MKWKSTRQAYQYLMNWGGPDRVGMCPIVTNAAKYLQKKGCHVDGQYYPYPIKPVYSINPNEYRRSSFWGDYSKQEIIIGELKDNPDIDREIINSLWRDV